MPPLQLFSFHFDADADAIDAAPPLHTMSVTLHDAAYYAADDAAHDYFFVMPIILFSRYAAAAAFDISAMLDDRYTLMPRSSRRTPMADY